jgi:26S proteasome regulatory subunit N3
MIVHSGQYDEAAKLVANSAFPLGASSSSSSSSSSYSPATLGTCSGANQARYHYYVALIEATRANYAVAQDHLEQAARKIPPRPTVTGFLQAVNRVLIVVVLLRLGTPDRSLFRQQSMRKALSAYLHLARAVLTGDLAEFQSVTVRCAERFTADLTLSLVQRLHQNVLRTGLKRLSIAYSRIPLVDIMTKLSLPSVDDAAYVVMKSIKDGTIEGHLESDANSGAGYYVAAESPLAYYTSGAQATFDQRILGLDRLHNECIKSMRYTAAEAKQKNGGNGGPPPTEADLIEEYLEGAGDGDDFM